MNANSSKPNRHRRLLRFESLESRQLLSITVNTLADENNGIGVGRISLRDAIAAAASGETINFAPSLTSNGPAGITLIHGHLLIDKDLTISGPGALLLNIDASGNDPTPDENLGDGSMVFFASDFDHARTVVISGLTLTGGDHVGSGGAINSQENLHLVDTIVSGNTSFGNGGGIYAYRGLVIANSTITGNRAALRGGGVANLSGSSLITSSRITNNTAEYGGGGISSLSATDLTITGSTITGNTNLGTTTGGGGIRHWGHNLTITDSTTSGNSAAGAGGIDADGTSEGPIILNATITGSRIEKNAGGGISSSVSRLTISASTISDNGGNGISTSGSELTVLDCTISGNVGRTAGGGISTFGTGGTSGSLLIKNSTISGNSSEGRGGGIFRRSEVSTSTANIINSTITGNVANFDGDTYGSGGGVHFVSEFGATLNLRNTIVAGNSSGAAARDDISGPVNARYSLIGVNTGTAITNTGGSQIGSALSPINPLLGPLVGNGGSTRTHSPLPGSTAIDRGDPADFIGVIGVPMFDQRGAPFTRVYNGDAIPGARIDIGAVERQPNPLAGDYNFDRVVNGADYVVWRKLFGSSTDLRADGDGNGTVAQPDFNVWKGNFGNTLAVGSGADATASFATAAAEESNSQFASPANATQAAPIFASVANTAIVNGRHRRVVNGDSAHLRFESRSRSDALLAASLGSKKIATSDDQLATSTLSANMRNVKAVDPATMDAHDRAFERLGVEKLTGRVGR